MKGKRRRPRDPRDIGPAVQGWLVLQRARIAKKRHPDLGEVSPYCFYATKLRFQDLAFDIGANHGDQAVLMVRRGARVVAVEPQVELAAQIVQRLPGVTVLAKAVGDRPGFAELHLAQERDDVASLDASWEENCDVPVAWKGAVKVPITTLDELIETYGEPRLVKIDTEGFEDRVLLGLSRPIEHVLFEVHASVPEVASRAFERLEQLGRYEYSVMWPQTWAFHVKSQRAEQILAELPVIADVYARRLG